MRILYILHKISSNYLKHNINERPFSIHFPRFCRIFPSFSSHSLGCAQPTIRAKPLTLSLSPSLSLARSSVALLTVQVFFSLFFSIYIIYFSPQNFPSCEFEWALVVWIVCFLIFFGIIKSLLLKFFHRFSFYLHLQFEAMSFAGARSGLCSLVHTRIALRFDFYFGSFHIAPVNNLKSPIYNNQWKEVKTEKKSKKKKNEQQQHTHKHKHRENKMENVCMKKIYERSSKWWMRTNKTK